MKFAHMSSYIITSFLVLSLVLVGCDRVTQTIYIQDAQISALVTPPPLHITSNQEAGTVTLPGSVSVKKQL